MPARILLRAALAGTCLAAAIASFMTYIAVVRLKDAFVEFDSAPNFARALRDMRASDSPLDPSTLRKTVIAVGLLRTGRPAEAEGVMANAVRREPENAAMWVTLARVQLTRGRPAAARASYAHSRRLNPHVPRRLPPPY